MATKPATTFLHATDAAFTSGPANTFDTKIVPPSPGQGFIPGTGIDAEHINYLENITGDWITNWVFLGTFAPDEDAHLVEADVDGTVSASRMSVGGSILNPFLPSLGVGTTAAGTAPSLSVTFGTGPNRAVSVSQSSAGSAVSAVFVQNTDGTGEVMELISSGSNTGRGLSITTQDANPAPLRLVGRNLPGGPALGDIYIDDEADHERLRVYHSSRFNSVWATPEGFARAFGTDRTQSSTSAGGFGAKTSAVFVASDGLVSGATVHVRATCEVGQGAIGTALDLRLRDVTAGADVIASEAQTALVVSAAAVEGYVTMEADYTLPGSGARTFALEFQSNGVDTIYIRRASIEVTGQY